MNRGQAEITYGVVGVGLMGIEHIRNLLHIPNTKITCVADDYPPSLNGCKELLERESPPTATSVKCFTNAVDLFASKLCHVAIIATPNHTHHGILMQAFTHADPTMHVLVEKPMCTTISDCREVMEAAKGRPGMTYVGLEYSYMPPISRIISDTKQGLIGPPRMVSIREHRFPFLQKVRNWNRCSQNSGGTFVEKCCHFFDLFNRILHPCVPISVCAFGAQDVNHLDEVYNGVRSDIFDNGYVIVEYSGGRRASLDLCMFAEASHHQEEVAIVGSKGKLEAFLPQLEVRTGIRGQNSLGNVKTEVVDDERIKYYGHHHGSSFLEHLEVFQVISSTAGEKVPISTAGLAQGLLSMAMGVAAHMSVEHKRIVRMNEIITDDELRMSLASYGNVDPRDS